MMKPTALYCVLLLFVLGTGFVWSLLDGNPGYIVEDMSYQAWMGAGAIASFLYCIIYGFEYIGDRVAE